MPEACVLSLGELQPKKSNVINSVIYFKLMLREKKNLPKNFIKVSFTRW